MGIGLLLIAAACAQPIWHRMTRGTIAVMVDLSPSTRGAGFRDAGEVRQRVGELVGDENYQLIGFAGGNEPIDPAGPWREMAADQTVFTPADADAILLFSDARFALPAVSPPVYAVVDPALEEPGDAAVEDLRVRDRTVSATVKNGGAARIASILEQRAPRDAPHPALSPEYGSTTLTAGEGEGKKGEVAATTEPVGEGTVVIERDVPQDVSAVSVQLSPGDLWPENDSLETVVTPAMSSERWWIGETSGPAGWRTFSPGAIPTNAEEFLAPSIIALDDVAADELSPAAMDRISQYVEELGGSLLIIGGPHAFGAGGYQGTRLEALSPLASSPPTPVQRWVILVDSSGSMSGEAGPSVSRWSAASEAAVAMLRKLPPGDDVEIGQFSEGIVWWSSGKSARETAELSLPPEGAGPHGPTNLEAALEQVAGKSEGNVPTEIVLVSDCDARIEKPGEIAAAMRENHARLNVLAIGSGEGLAAVRQIAVETGGAVLSQDDPGKWIDAAKKIVLGALADAFVKSSIYVQFMGPAESVPGRTVGGWNRVWLRKDATIWGTGANVGDTIPVAASWAAGTGRVAAVAFEPSDVQLQRLADLAAQRPRDPRFSAQWDTKSTLRVSLNAVDGARAMNDLKIWLQLNGPAGPVALEQTGPGKYSAEIPEPRESTVATLRVDGQVFDRVAVAGRYPPEFDAIGNDHVSMRVLAERSGGAVIGADEHGRIDFRWPRRDLELGAWFAGGGVILIGAGLVKWRRA
jgi:hypothetical protein